MSKKANKTTKAEGNIYDRIFRENAEQLFFPLIEKELNIKIKKYKLLPEKLPKTFEREIDTLYEVIIENGEKQLIHVEYQTKDDPLMIFRMGIYHGMALSKYKIPIKHIVFYLGKGKSKMRSKLTQEEIFKEFTLISINAMDANTLLQSQIPEVFLLSVLGKYKTEQTEEILRSVINKLIKVSKSKKELSKFHQQLIILTRLRKLEERTTKIIDDMPINLDIEKDFLYNKGIDVGLMKGENIGLLKGKDIGIKEGLEVVKYFTKGLKPTEIAEKTGLKLAKVKSIIKDFLA